MFLKLIGFFSPPEFENFEFTQKAKFLHFTLLITSGACIFLGIQNMGGNTSLDVLIFILGGFSLLCVPLNKSGYYIFTALFIATLIFAVMTYSLIDGVGLKDAGLLAYPLFIIFATFLFGKNKAPLITLLSIASVVLVYYLDKMGYLTPSRYSNENQLTVIVALFIATGFFLWAVMDNWERIMRNLTETYYLTLFGWSKALEYRDKETEGHSIRVTELTEELAKHMGIPNQELRHIHHGALLHDIGKMAVPDSILLKKGELTEEEWAVVKMHPLRAKELLENIPFLKPAMDIPYRHHERWNGTGYPDGLSKKDIPLSARIFAIVDVWDAITSDRPYRQAWSKEKSLAYIREQSGILFDPQIVQVFLELIDNEEHKH